MKDKIIPILMVLGLSMFCGIIVIAIGIGSMFVSVNKIAAPLVCGNRQLRIDQQDYSYHPGERTITITSYCVDAQTGAEQDVSTQLHIVAGVMYGLIVFALMMIFLKWAARRLNISFEEMFKPKARRKK